jgi:hypothetical protein
MQKGLFDELPKEDRPQTSSELLHLTIEPRKQSEINTKIKKIKKLKEAFEKTKADIQQLKDTYHKLITPVEEQFLRDKEKFLVKLHKRWKERGFSAWQSDLIMQIIQNEINEIRNYTDTSKVVDEVSKEIVESQKAQLSDEEKKMMNSMAKDFFNFSGIDADLDEDENFDFFSDNPFENFGKRQEESQNESNAQEKRDKVLNTDKDFQKLYKRLVKKAHPDLVIDPAEKEQRESLMKELSQAWEERDYYKLLLLKSDIEQDDDVPIALGEAQTKTLISQLNAEISLWNQKSYELKHHAEESSFYYQSFYSRSTKISLNKVKAFKDHLEQLSELTYKNLAQLKTKKSTKEFLKHTRVQFDKKRGDIFDDW